MALVMVEPGVLADFITTPAIKWIIASLFLHEDSHHKVAQNVCFKTNKQTIVPEADG